MSLIVDCLDSQYDYENAISAERLSPYSLYELKLVFLHKSGSFRSFGIYHSDEHGKINLAQDAPIRGTYTGVRPMGLFESYEPCEDFPFGGYAKYLATEVWNYELRLIDSTGKQLDCVKIIKRFMNPKLRRVEVEENGICGTLFIPPGDGPFPSLIEFSGTGGGINEQKAAALASEGFCVLTLSFFQFKDLPAEFNDVELEYFIKAINWFTSLPYTSDKIGIHANSVGGLIALIMARECPRVCAVVSIDPPHGLNTGAYFNYQGKPLPYATVNFEKVEFLNGIMHYNKPIQTMDMTPGDLQLERIPVDVAIRFVVSLDDQSTSAHFSVLFLQNQLRQPGRYLETQLENGGHLMEPPCFPHHAFCFTKISGTYMGYGGECSQHGVSQEKVWKKTVEFLKNRVPVCNEGECRIASKL